MSGKSRLDRLSEDLSARERAILAARALAAGEEPPWRVHWTMPEDQIEQYNDLAVMVNGVYGALLPHAIGLQSEAKVVQRELGMLALVVVWGAERQLLVDKAVAALETEREKPTKAQAKACHDLRELLESDHTPNAPEVLLPALATKMGRELASEGELTSMDRMSIRLASHLQSQIPMLYSWLMTLEQAVGTVTHALDESAVPQPLWDLLADTHQILDGLEGVELYLGELPSGEIDEELATQLAEKLRGN